ncbi:MAG: ATP-binding domain-containing protein, partial [Methylococcales bacterium]|nr:ATP-binding domain-containing protein [Methylococcales bacterium]
PNHQLIKLEQNYRSTGNILKSANALIKENEGRMGKDLWTSAGDGELISIYTAFNEQDEAYFVVEKIKQWVADGGLREDIAILYRSNAQSRQFEERLMSTATPYRVYGGLRFFERMEIKNALAYLRVMSNHQDDASFERVINTPTRGIGAKTIDDIRLLARESEVSLWKAAVQLIKQERLPPRASNALKGFLVLITQLGRETAEKELYERVKTIVERSGLIELYKKEKGEKGEARIENLEELVNAARAFDANEEQNEDLSELDSFLAHAALESGDMQGDDYESCVQLMTLHSAKGLEFKLVFLVGLEEGLFPSQRSTSDIAKLEEERRLCYVGITRAMKQLYITYAESRRLYGKESYSRPSRFLKEIPPEFIQEIRIRANINKPVSTPRKKSSSAKRDGTYKVGQKVSHAKFGEGVVLQTEGEGGQEKVQINFSRVGLKWLVLSYAKLDVKS